MAVRICGLASLIWGFVYVGWARGTILDRLSVEVCVFACLYGLLDSFRSFEVFHIWLSRSDVVTYLSRWYVA